MMSATPGRHALTRALDARRTLPPVAAARACAAPGRPTKRRPRGRVLEARALRGRREAAPAPRPGFAPRLRPRYRGARRPAPRFKKGARAARRRPPIVNRAAGPACLSRAALRRHTGNKDREPAPGARAGSRRRPKASRPGVRIVPRPNPTARSPLSSDFRRAVSGRPAHHSRTRITSRERRPRARREGTTKPFQPRGARWRFWARRRRRRSIFFFLA